MADHPHTIDRWDDATGENLIEQIAAVGDYLVATYRAATAGSLMQKFDILPPQPASQSLTHTESGRARNATKWRLSFPLFRQFLFARDRRPSQVSAMFRSIYGVVVIAAHRSNCSSSFPSLIAATSQRGVAPRPAHVSPSGPRYFGTTSAPSMS